MNKETSLGVVTIKFDNPKYNYTTNVSSSTTEAEAKRFFVGKMFNVGSYPKENMQKVIGIDFSKSDDKMKKGGGILGDDNHWKNMPKGAAKNLAEYYGNKKLAFNKKELNLSKKDLAELKEVQMMINKYHPEFNHYLSLMHKESKMKTGGGVGDTEKLYKDLLLEYEKSAYKKHKLGFKSFLQGKKQSAKIKDVLDMHETDVAEGLYANGGSTKGFEYSIGGL